MQTSQQDGKATTNEELSEFQAFYLKIANQLVQQKTPLDISSFLSGERDQLSSTLPRFKKVDKIPQLPYLYNSCSTPIFSLSPLDLHTFIDELLVNNTVRQQVQYIAQSKKNWKPSKHLVESDYVIYNVSEEKIREGKELRRKRLQKQLNEAVKQFVIYTLGQFIFFRIQDFNKKMSELVSTPRNISLQAYVDQVLQLKKNERLQQQ